MQMHQEKQAGKKKSDSSTIKTRLSRLASLMPDAMIQDRIRAEKKIHAIGRLHPERQRKKIFSQLAYLERMLSGSLQRKVARSQGIPEIDHNTELPIYSKKDDIIHAIKHHPVVIISGETGSGKTTQIPKFCLAAGRGISGKIGCTQPRRIAAITVSERISQELDKPLGRVAGYKIRFTDNTDKNAYIKVMTDGILLAEAQKDPQLSEYDTLIVDEAHERSLNIDFILGILKTLVKRRKNLKVVITSATIDTEKFSKAFDDAPVIEVSGRMYPVDVHYMPVADDTAEDDGSYVEKAVEAADFLIQSYPGGDMLIFMPTQQDILETREILEGRRYSGTRIMPLFARLTAAEQTRVFAKTTGRKIIIATNIAETSITIPGIRYVIDTGLARIPRYTPRTRTTSLRVSPISKSSADQRKGRCGRVANGLCIRLYAEDDYVARPQYTLPEILRANLAEVILKMTALGIGDIWRFPFVDPPAPKSISDGFDLLTELDALNRTMPSGKHQKPRYRLTAKGKKMATLPADPRLSCMLLEAAAHGCEPEMLVIAAALTIMDPRERPLEKAQAADAAHKAFDHPASDFLSLLNIWNAFHQTLVAKKTTSQLRKFCKTNFLSYKRMREWQDVHWQLTQLLNDDRDSASSRKAAPTRASLDDDGLYDAVHKSVLSGFLSNIARNKENNFYTAAKGREVMVFPGSSLFNQSRPWIVCAEIVETSRVFARIAAGIDVKWLEPIAKNICTYTHSNPRWDAKRGEVVATEQVSLFGLIIAADRSVSYGRINPEEACAIFIQGALVEGRTASQLGFTAHNRRLMDEARDMENRLRRRDILVDDTLLFDFYQTRLKNIYSIKTLKKKIKTDGDAFLKMKPDDVFAYMPDAGDLALYPDTITLGNQAMGCEYAFDPGSEADGVTIKIPAAVASAVPTDEMDWLVPGLFREKIAALIKGLPKSLRKQLIPISDTVDIICRQMPRENGSLLSLLARFIYQRFNVDIPLQAWPQEQMPDHLTMRISVVGANGKEIRSSRDKTILTDAHPVSQPDDGLSPIYKKWEREDITTWDFPDLPECIHYTAKDNTRWTLYPGLAVKESGRIDLKLFIDAAKAAENHKTGMVALYERQFSKDLKFIKKALAIPGTCKDQVMLFGGKQKMEALLFHEVMAALFKKDIRSQKAFLAHGEAMAANLLNQCRILTDAALPVMNTYFQTHQVLSALERDNRFNAAAQTILTEMTGQARRLVPENFIAIYSTDRLPHLQRYLKAIEIRTKRAILAPEKDRAKAETLKPHIKNLEALVAELSPHATVEKRAALESFFWLVEEYKVSVFAQELKTAVTVSSKILTKQYETIRRMA